jgi:hypothetical protein
MSDADDLRVSMPFMILTISTPRLSTLLESEYESNSARPEIEPIIFFQNTKIPH